MDIISINEQIKKVIEYKINKYFFNFNLIYLFVNKIKFFIFKITKKLY